MGRNGNFGAEDFHISYPGDNSLHAEITGTDGDLMLDFEECKLTFRYTGSGQLILRLCAKAEQLPFIKLEDREWQLCHEGFSLYSPVGWVSLYGKRQADEVWLETEENTAVLHLDCRA